MYALASAGLPATAACCGGGVHMPTSHITNVCFGGPGLQRLFVSSARAGLSADQLAAQPLAGSLFEVRSPGATGLPGLPFGGQA